MVHVAILFVSLAVLNYWMSYVVGEVLGCFAQMASLFLSAMFLLAGFVTLMNIL